MKRQPWSLSEMPTRETKGAFWQKNRVCHRKKWVVNEMGMCFRIPNRQGFKAGRCSEKILPHTFHTFVSEITFTTANVDNRTYDFSDDRAVSIHHHVQSLYAEAKPQKPIQQVLHLNFESTKV